MQSLFVSWIETKLIRLSNLIHFFDQSASKMRQNEIRDSHFITDTHQKHERLIIIRKRCEFMNTFAFCVLTGQCSMLNAHILYYSIKNRYSLLKFNNLETLYSMRVCTNSTSHFLHLSHSVFRFNQINGKFQMKQLKRRHSTDRHLKTFTHRERHTHAVDSIDLVFKCIPIQYDDMSNHDLNSSVACIVRYTYCSLCMSVYCRQNMLENWSHTRLNARLSSKLKMNMLFHFVQITYLSHST